MDLRERCGEATTRHPWEVARLRALGRILGEKTTSAAQVLDVGCGDLFLARELFRQSEATVVGVEPEGVSLPPGSSPMEIVKGLEEVSDRRFDLVLMLDVLEHVEDDEALLLDVTRLMADAGALLITVPAFPILFSAHDRWLRHYRRYRLGQLRQVVHRCGLREISSGYLFSSLLPLRALSRLGQQLFPRHAAPVRGVGGWTAGPLTTRLLTAFLDRDNLLNDWLRGRGIAVPGLSAWALCNKPSSSSPATTKQGD
jgi:SAM-dependent methyltransferase